MTTYYPKTTTYHTFHKYSIPARPYDKPNVEESLAYQPYRTTPLILPGAKIAKDPPITESFLRHHPNPAMRAPPHHEYHEQLMKQKIAHKQFNSPIGLYSDSNIESTIKQTVPYKKTVVFDPTKSETFKVLHEEEQTNYGGYRPQQYVQEPQPAAQPKVFRPNRLIPAKKPVYSNPAPAPAPWANTTGDPNDIIHQSNSFKRLMYSVMDEY